MLLPGEIDITRHAPNPGCSPAAAQKYTRWLATHHYENFNVVSWLLPKHLHQHFYNVYAYCRWADDCGEGYSQAALRGFAESLPPGSNRQALFGLGFRPALLRVLGESRRAAGV